MFDFDGVLVDSAELARSSYMTVREQMGLDVLPELSSVSDLATVYQGQLSKSLTRWVSYETAEVFWGRHAAACRDGRPQEAIYPELVEALKELADLDDYAVVTGAHGERVHRALRGSGCGESALVIDRAQPGTKGEKLTWLRSRMGATCYVGDTGSDMLHAEAACLNGVAVSYGYGSLDDAALASAPTVLRTPEELAAWIRQHGGAQQRAKVDSGDN